MRKITPQTRMKLSEALTTHFARPGARQKHSAATLQKLSPKDFKRIYKDPRPHADIAADFGISLAYVSAIKTGRRGQHYIGG